MSIDQTDRVDIIGVERDSGDVVLTITDHLDWIEQPGEHLLLLQEKINTYLSFVESGELLEAYPDAKGRNVVISVVAQYPLSEEARRFLDGARPVIEAAGFTFRHRMA